MKVSITHYNGAEREIVNSNSVSDRVGVVA